MKYFILLLAISVTALQAVEPSLPTLPQKYKSQYAEQSLPEADKSSTHFVYMGMGMSAPVPFPHLKIGARKNYHDNYALDGSIGVSSVVFLSSISAEMSYLKYLSKDHFYAGGGIGFFGFWLPISRPSRGLGTDPFITVGKENARSFYQIAVAPAYITTDGSIFLPHATYQFGFKF